MFNTHFDHLGVTARISSAKLITEKITQLTKENRYPVVVAGDFNSRPDEAPVLDMQEHFNNTRNSSQEKAYGTADTWNGFACDKKPDGCIDYIFVSAHKNLLVEKFATITDSYDMKYQSDHFPIMATLELKK